MQSNVLPMFPGEHHFTNRPVTANNSYGPQYVPEAPMWLDAVPSDFGPMVNPRAPRDEVLFDYSARQIALMAIAVNAVLALLIIGAAYMGVSV